MFASPVHRCAAERLDLRCTAAHHPCSIFDRGTPDKLSPRRSRIPARPMRSDILAQTSRSGPYGECRGAASTLQQQQEPCRLREPRRPHRAHIRERLSTEPAGVGVGGSKRIARLMDAAGAAECLRLATGTGRRQPPGRAGFGRGARAPEPRGRQSLRASRDRSGSARAHPARPCSRSPRKDRRCARSHCPNARCARPLPPTGRWRIPGRGSWSRPA